MTEPDELADDVERSFPAGSTVAFVFAGGDGPEPDALVDLDRAALIVAADSGLHHVERTGRQPHLLVGDFDSVLPAALATAEAEGIPVERHPPAKDETDLELALDRVLAAGVTHVVVVGAGGGRLDHLLANLLLLTAPRYAPMQIEARQGGARVHVVRDRPLAWWGQPGDLVTLLAVGEPAVGVTTRGLRYPLTDETLLPGSTRGVSNELRDRQATVTVRAGALLAVRPGERGTRLTADVQPSDPGGIR